MNLEKTYQSILDESFRRKFADWDQITPLDPMKAFTEGVSCALAEIEKRQVRLTDLLVNSLPAFFGFERKPAEAQEFYFQLKDAQSLRNVFKLPAQSTLTLQDNSKRFQAQVTESHSIFPVDNFKVRHEDNKLLLSFSLRGGATEVKLFVVAPEAANPNYLESGRMTVSHLDGKKQLWQESELFIEDQSQAGTQSGYLTFRPKTGAPLFPQKGADYEITLEFAEPFQGTDVLFNVAPLSLRNENAQVKLGALTGQPWEQIPLPEELLEVPQAVRLALPNQEVVIHRVEMDLLKIRTAEPERFERSFFYEPFSHSLIFPGSHRLVGSLNGTVPIIVDKAVTALPSQSNLKESRLDAGELRIAIEGGSALFERRHFIPRENQVDFLKRFYTAVRFFTASQSFTPGILKEDLERELAGCHKLVRNIEIEVNTQEKRVDVYVLTHSAMVQKELHLPDDVATSVSERLAQRVPLDYQYRLIPFRKVRLEVAPMLSAALPAQRAGVVSEALLKDRIETTVSRLLLPEILLPGGSLNKAKLAEQVREALAFPKQDHTHLLNAEIESFEVLMRQIDHGLYLDVLFRQPGEIFELTWATTVNLMAATVPVTAQRSTRRPLHA